MDDENVIQRIAKNTSWLFLSDVISKGFAFLLTIAIARYLGVEDFGIYSFVLSFVALFVFLPDFGLSTLTTRDVAHDNTQAKKYLENITIVKIYLSALTFIIIAILVYVIGKPSDVITLVYLAAIYMILDSFNQFFRSFFRAFEKMEYEGIIKIIHSIILLFFGLFVILADLGLQGLMFAYVLTSAIDVAISIYFIKKHFTHFKIGNDIPFCKNALKKSSFFLLSVFLMTLYFKIDITMLSIMVDDRAVGLYSSSYYIVVMMNIIPSAFLPALFPNFSINYNKSSENISKIYSISLKYLFIISICISTFLILFSRQILYTLYGSEFIPAIPTFNILVLAGGIIIVDRIGVDLQNAIKKQKINSIIIGMCALLNILLNLALIPIYEEFGAALATLLTEIVLFILLLISTKKYIDIKYIFSTNDLMFIHRFIKRLYKSK